jgi:ubiquinone/menaquinone biosynthesis C-methylase UbiE
MSFEELLVARSAAVYADFLVPHLGGDVRLVDCGCGAGSITVQLAPLVRWVVGVDLNAAVLAPAVDHLRVNAIANASFVAADGMALPFADASVDAVLMHSVLEAAIDPAALIDESRRVLLPGGVLAAASVDYGGRILAGPRRDELERFYAVRERLWRVDRIARPRAGRDLRRLLRAGGFTAIEATAHYLSYGTAERVRSFGEARAVDCEDPWFASRSLAAGLYTDAELRETRRAWEEWSRSPESFLAFAWCRVLGRKPAAS